jgi:alcohol dehydrogenase (NADP+)
MEKLVDLKLTRFLGVSNFSPKQIDEILAVATIKPKVNQIEVHPYLQQQEFITSLQSKGIDVTAYAPLANTNQAYNFLGGNQVPRLLTNPKLNAIAKAKGCTAAQVALAWNMARKVVVIPKAAQEAHQKENIATIEKCKLQAEDMEKMKALQVPLRLMNVPCRPLGNACFQGLEGA